jgi:hypothetical protein
VLSRLKPWLQGSSDGSVQPHQPACYLDEFGFRFNHRHSRGPGLLLDRLVQEADPSEPIPLRAIVGGEQGCTGRGREHATRDLRSGAGGVGRQ